MLKRNTNMILKLFLIAFLIVLVIFILRDAQNIPRSSQVIKSSKQPVESSTLAPKKVLISQPRLYPKVIYSVYFDIDTTKEFLAKVRVSISELKQLDKTAYTIDARSKMIEELSRLQKVEAKVASDLNHFITWEREHYYSANAWLYFRQRNYNRAVTSAILGNMMIETSGGSLNLKPTVYNTSGNYYGLCQWSLKYYPEAEGLPFEHQLDYLIGTMPWEFNTFGWLYKEDFSYEDFLKLEDPAEAALAFAIVYERCGSASYGLRQQAAQKAYEYFDLNS